MVFGFWRLDILKYLAAASLVGVIAWGSRPPQVTTTQCAPNTPLSEAQTARRRSAIQAARQINTAEAQYSAKTKRYAPLLELTGVMIPQGFDAQVSTDGESYTFLVKDTEDPCKLAVFSDQKGLIYTAAPLQ